MQQPEGGRQAAAAQVASLFTGGAAAAFEQLRQARDRVDSILQLVVGDDGVVVQDFTGRVVYANEPAARLLGAASAAALMRSPTSGLLRGLVMTDESGGHVPPELPGTPILRGAPAGERTLRFVQGNEAPRWATVRSLPLLDDAGGIVSSVSIFRDITEQRQTADFRENLLGIASHDLRGPLSAIHMAAALLARRPEQLDRTNAKLVLQIQASTDRAVRMVRDLLDLTQARIGGGIPVKPVDVEVEPLLSAVVNEALAAHPERTIALRCTDAGSAQWDPDRITQVLANLLGNATTYAAPDTTITIDVVPGEDVLAIAVHNHGPVIPPGHMPHLFEPYVRGTAVGSAQRSVGLGLYIVKEIVSSHGGAVSATSHPQEGTTFVVRLPRRQPAGG